MGKIIALIVIAAALYWGNRYRKATIKEEADKKKKKANSADFDESPGDVIALKAYYERKIAEIESKSHEEIARAQELLTKYKKELEQINQLKNK